tara:strand:+ start:335 stop:643 length:309 start_codon:yes stop_codon:yes gene_type:complete
MRVPRHKYRAVRTELDGIKFASKKEAEYYAKLKMAYDGKGIVGFLRQVPFYLDGVKYVCDYLVFNIDGSTSFIDVKGVRTPQYKAKMKQMRVLYPWVTIEEV